MEKPNVRCAILSTLIAKHRWGSPMDDEALLAFTGLGPNQEPVARDVIDDLRAARYIENCGKRGLKLDSSEFQMLADVLYYDCEWEPFEIESRLKHYEGWSDHDWA
ncbi:hypothetical protein [Natronoglomus mannanivorans]|uniref:Uncharacterized protein n=1 Tax=Natronoglomus mannanivorans TaxID=2979990 RepID=A0AAP3E1J4_9EURY|nr:hypothetical protein [Halobacteria archaeon AArc-xg1-1]